MKPQEIKLEKGILRVEESQDSNYPGIDIEFIANDEKDNIISRPRILIEQPVGEKLRALIWNDEDQEDYSIEITFEKPTEAILNANKEWEQTKRDIYNEQKMNYLIDDAKNHVEDYLQNFNETSDTYIDMNKIPENTYKMLAERFKSKHDCDLADNDQWDNLVYDYFTNEYNK